MSLPIILALDTKDLNRAGEWIKASSDQIDHFKIGLEFYYSMAVKGSCNCVKFAISSFF